MEFLAFLLGVDAIDEYLAIALLEDTADDTHEGGFACTVGTQQTEHAGVDVHGDGIQRFEGLFLVADDRYFGRYTVDGFLDFTETPVNQVNVDVVFVDALGKVMCGDAYIPNQPQEDGSTGGIREFDRSPNQGEQR